MGVIYVHRISDFKMGGISMRNLTMFRHLCGDSALANVAIVTNMWGQVSKETGEAREAELANKDKFFKPLLERSARLLRHDNTLSSAQAIVDSLVHNPPRPLRIQKELVDEGKDVSQTAAGEELNRELAEQAKRNLQELEAVQKEMEEAIRENDGETRKELEIEQRKLQMEISRVQSESRNLATGFLRRKEEAKQESVRVAMERERELRELQLLITQNESLAAVEEDAIPRQSREVSAQRLPCEQNATRSQRVPEAPVPYPTPVPRQRHHHSQASCDGAVRGPILPSPEDAELRQMLSAVQRQYDEPPPRTDGPLTMLFNFVLPRDGSKTAQSRYPEDDYATAAPSSKGSKGGGGRGKQRHAHGGPDDSHGSTS